MLTRLQQPRHLHREGRAARDDVTTGNELKSGADHRTADRRRYDRNSACLRKQTASAENEDRHLSPRRASANAPPASHRRVAVALRGRARYASTQGSCRELRVPMHRPQPHKATMMARRRAGCCKYALPAFHSRRDLDRARGGLAKAVRPIHVLNFGLRQHISARRHRTHHIGNRKDRAMRPPPVEGRGEAVVAEFAVHRLGAAPQSSRARRSRRRRPGADCRSRTRPADSRQR